MHGRNIGSMQDLNQQPRVLKANAITTELISLMQLLGIVFLLGSSHA